MWIKGTFLLLFALTIDALQAIMAWIFLGFGSALQAITPVGGFIAGAATGATVCWNSSGTVVQGAVDAVKCAAAGGVFGAAISASGAPLGVGLGFAIDVAISITMGSGLILALFLFGMFDLKYVAAVFVGETIPGLDVVPGWTFLVIRCILKKNAEEARGITGVASGIASAVLSPSSPTGVLASMARGISDTKNIAGDTARTSSLVRNAYESEPVQNITRERAQLASDVGREIKTRPSNNPQGINPFYAKTA